MSLSKLPRLTGWLLLTLLLLLLILFSYPEQLPVVLYKCALVSLGSVMAYWVDRSMFYYDRPHTYTESGEDLIPRGLAMLRRAIICCACVLGLTMGL